MSVLRTVARVPIPAARVSVRTAFSRSIITVKEQLYNTTATATGEGRKSGNVRVEGYDGTFETSQPGTGKGINPEQLVAAGYSACFLGALRLAASQEGIKLGDDVKSNVKMVLGKDAQGGFAVSAEVTVSGNGVTKALVDKTHTICPYSKAFSHGIDIKLAVA